jgi:hypothetical protein
MLRGRADWLAVALCLVFVGLGCLWIGEMGIQTDEALFVNGVYRPYHAEVVLFGKPRALMVMSYVGALKAAIWKPILRNLGVSAYTIRVPAVLLGGLSVWLFYALMKRTVGLRAALVATALLSFDATYILTVRWDWGPVAIQHVCLVGGALAVLQFRQTRGLRWLALGFFVFGLGLWDKAIFFWSLTGMGVATLAVFPRDIWRLLTWRSFAVASVSIVAGASPLICYNVLYDYPTLRQNSAWAPGENVAGKLWSLASTVNGSGMFGGVTREPADGPIREPDDSWKRLWVAVTDWSGTQRKTLYEALAVLSLLLLPFVWRTARRPVVFAIVFCVVAWLQMANAPGGGGSPHHVILLWPFPWMIVGVVFAELSRRFGRLGMRALVAMTVLAACSSLAVLGTYYTEMLRNGGVKEWTDAIYPAAKALSEMKPTFACSLDWGVHDNLKLLTAGRVPLCAAVDPAADAETAKRQMAVSDIVYVTHVEGQRLFPEVTERFMAVAGTEGFRRSEARVFHDYNGRPMIEFFKLKRP